MAVESAANVMGWKGRRMDMALRYALLGLLSRENMTGYDLTQKFAEQIGYFWNAHHTQIYRELQKLEDEGLVSHHRIEQLERPDKKLYEVTDKGYRGLVDWLASSPQKPPKMKNESLLRVALFHLVPPEQAIRFLEESKEMHNDAMRQIEAWRDDEFGDKPPTRDNVGVFLTVENGIRFLRTWSEWCDFAIDVFKKMES
jgi:PadR family transcriptional regulator, regulatory protein AphA